VQSRKRPQRLELASVLQVASSWGQHRNNKHVWGWMRENQTTRDPANTPFFQAHGVPASSLRILVLSKAELGASGMTFANVIPTVLGLWAEPFFVFLAM